MMTLDTINSLIKQRLFWPGIDSYIKTKVKARDRCIRRMTNIGQWAELIPIESSAPMEIVCIDYLSLEPSKWWCQKHPNHCRSLYTVCAGYSYKESDSQDCG